MTEPPDSHEETVTTREPQRRDAESSDEAVIRRVLGGEPSAYGELVERHEPKLRAVVTGLVGDVHVVDDVLQETFLAAYRALRDFRWEARFSTWLTRIAIREATRARTRLRKLWRSLAPLDAGSMADETRSVERRCEARDEVLAMLAALPVRERVPMVLHVVEGRTYEEIAEILGCPSGTVGSHLSRARARLRRRVAGDADAARTRPELGESERAADVSLQPAEAALRLEGKSP